MEKRLYVAILLSFVVLFGWSLVFPPPPVEPDPLPTTEGVEGVSPEEEVAAQAPEAAAVGETEERRFELTVGEPSPEGELDPGHYHAVFNNRGARLESLHFGDYVRSVDLEPAQRLEPENWMPLVEPVETADGLTGSLLLRAGRSAAALVPGGLENALWTMAPLGGGPVGVEFTYSPGGGEVLFTKRVEFLPGTWEIAVSLAIENRGDASPGRREFLFVPAGCLPPELGDSFYQEPQAVAIGVKGDGFTLESVSAPSLSEPEGLDVPLPVAVAGVHGKYFAFLAREARADEMFSEAPPVDVPRATLGRPRALPILEMPAFAGDEARELVEIEIPLLLELPPKGERKQWDYLIYAGPKSYDEMVGSYGTHELILDEDLSSWSLFTAIGRLLLGILGFFHGLTGNWGVAIILLTLCVRFALFPINRRSQTAMARYQTKMKRVQPRLEESKKKYADDPQKQREAQARIMQEEGAFPPLGGCLPMFLQLPVFLGLFSALRTSFDLRQAPFFGYIKDLSHPDELLYLGLELPILPDIEYLNILPLLMVALWILQQRGMPQPQDEQAARMQKMMMFMPILFGFMLYNYAAGLSLYMITSSGVAIFEQKVIKKLWPIDDAEVTKKSEPSGCGPFSGMMEQMAERQREQMKRMEAMKKASGGGNSKKRKKR